MTSSTIRKVIGALKDQASITIAKVAGTLAPELEVLVVKATTHDEDPAGEKHLQEIVSMTLASRGYVGALVAALSKRLNKTEDWVVAVKCLVLVHRVVVEGHVSFQEEVVVGMRQGARVLNLGDFQDEAHSDSWDYSNFVKVYAAYLEEKVECAVNARRKTNKRSKESEYGEFRDRYMDEFGYRVPWRSRSYRNSGEPELRQEDSDLNSDPVVVASTPMKEMRTELVLGKLNQSLRLLDRILACEPSGVAKRSRLVIVAFYLIVKESFGVYADITEALKVLFDRFTEIGYEDGVKAFNLYVAAAKLINELDGLFEWCKDFGVGRSSEFPEVKRVSDEDLVRLERLLKEMRNRRKRVEKEQVVKDEEIKALPLPENHTPLPAQPPPPAVALESNMPVQPPKPNEDLVDLRDTSVSAEKQGNVLALALFSGPATTSSAAELGRADWELALVECAANLPNQKAADFGGGLDPLVLNGMYDLGAARQHGSVGSGSISSVARPGAGPLLALPSPDGTMQGVGHRDPFAASLALPVPSYAQIADVEMKQRLLVQEQLVWQQYGSQGMQGQVGPNGNAHQNLAYGMPGYYSQYPPN